MHRIFGPIIYAKTAPVIVIFTDPPKNSSLSSSFLHVVKKTSEVSGGIARNAHIAFSGRGRQRKAKAK